MSRRKSEFRFVFFDGTVASMSVLLWALSQIDKRVWIYVDESVFERYTDFLHQQRDCAGTLGHFEGSRYVWHIVPSPIIPTVYKHEKVLEYYFEVLSQMKDYNEILQHTIVCHQQNGPCLRCCSCVQADLVAQAYGIYDSICLTSS